MCYHRHTALNHTRTLDLPPSRGPLAHPVRTGALGGAGGDVIGTVGVRMAVCAHESFPNFWLLVWVWLRPRHFCYE